jgi:hypothetical protein
MKQGGAEAVRSGHVTIVTLIKKPYLTIAVALLAHQGPTLVYDARPTSLDQ